MEWAIADHYPRHHLPAGTTLFREGDFGTSMYFVVAGSLRVSKRVIEGTDKILSTLDAGQYVGEMCLLIGAKRSATVQALIDSEVIEINQQAFMELLHDQPQMGLELMRQMSRRLEEANEELILLALEMALAQRQPQRLQPSSRRMRFVAIGSFTHDKAAEVLRLVAAHASSTTPPRRVDQPPSPRSRPAGSGVYYRDRRSARPHGHGLPFCRACAVGDLSGH